MWNDLDNDAQKDGGEPGQSGWTVFLDGNNNGLVDAGIASAPSSGTIELPIPDVSTVTAAMNVSGVVGQIVDLNVGLNISPHLRLGSQRVPRQPLGPLGVKLLANVGDDGENFVGTVLDDEAATSINSGTAPFTGSYRPLGSLAAVDGQSPNGTWLLEITDGYQRRRRHLARLDTELRLLRAFLAIRCPRQLYDHAVDAGRLHGRRVVPGRLAPDISARRDLQRHAGLGADIVLGRDFGNSAGVQVTNTLDTGAGSLRAALEYANATAGVQTISFSIPGAGVHTIQPATPAAVYQRGGNHRRHDAAGLRRDAVGGDQWGFGRGGGRWVAYYGRWQHRQRSKRFTSSRAMGSSWSAEAAARSSAVIWGRTPAARSIAGNGLYGLRITGSPANTIGGTTAAARNVISGNDQGGIVVSAATATGNQVQGNYIGTTASGTAALKNGYYGIMLSNAPANTIGGARRPVPAT